MFTLPDLDYGYADFKRYISKDIMELHHTKHHQAYVDKLNTAISQYSALGDKSVDWLLQNLPELPQDIRQNVRNMGGGHLNHSLFWKFMSPDGGGEPDGELIHEIEKEYGSFQAFVDKFSEKAIGVFGSGWVWLMPNMSIMTTPNQDNPIMEGQPLPILGLDVWEHAYYLDYTYKRADYVSSWWNVVNWGEVSERLADYVLGQ